MKKSKTLKLHLYKHYFCYQDEKDEILTIKYRDVARIQKYFDHISITLDATKNHPYYQPTYSIPNPDGLILYERLINVYPHLAPLVENAVDNNNNCTQLSLFSLDLFDLGCI